MGYRRMAQMAELRAGDFWHRNYDITRDVCYTSANIREGLVIAAKKPQFL